MRDSVCESACSDHTEHKTLHMFLGYADKILENVIYIF